MIVLFNQEFRCCVKMSRRTAKQKISQFVRLGLLGGGVCGGILLYKYDERAYRSLSSFIHTCLDGETAHKAAVLALSNGFYFKCRHVEKPELKVKLWGLEFSNPVGIAAGFDKHGEAVQGLRDVGFGFVEVGSVTPQPQEGNPRPRVFRLDEDAAVINRYGFNSEGHLEVRRRLELLRAGGFNGVLGINLGKNKTSSSAVDDYVAGVRQFSHLADYLVINVSSPNTPGLRSLQSRSDLKTLISAVLAARQTLNLSKLPPLLVKIAPDLTEDDLKDIAQVVTEPDSKVDGLIVSNTTVTRPDSLTSGHAQETGGLSGSPLRDISTETIRQVYQLTGGQVPIIGVGGVSSGQEAWQKVVSGASLVQVYTAMVFQGPVVASKIRKELEVIVKEAGFNNIQEAVGSYHRK